MSHVHLSSGRVNLLTIRDNARRRFTDLFIQLDGTKVSQDLNDSITIKLIIVTLILSADHILG